jgi:hypothetical protein
VSDIQEVFTDGGVVKVTDGLGDERATDPYPLLGAGIFLSGASGQNGTARFQAEFSLASLVGQTVSSAFLVLNSEFAANQTLDTFFFHVTSDEEGNVTTNDFQSPVEPTGLVQPPVLANGTHMYDVTSFLKADLLAGFAFTSYQGRVNELADTKFRRGVEFFSMALEPTVNDNPALRPRLVVEFAAVPEPSSVLLFSSAAAALVAWGRCRRSKSAG